MSVDNILNVEQQALARDREISRILACCSHDYFALLDIDPLADWESAVKRAYRKKTLLVHPDKVAHPQAPAAFDRIKRAESVLSDGGAELERLLAIYQDARAVAAGMEGVRAEVARILETEIKNDSVERDFEQRQEARRAEEATKARAVREARKQRELQWEDDRDERVKNWRQYTLKVTKKKRKNKVLA